MDNKQFKQDLIRRAFIFSRSVICIIDAAPNKRSVAVISNQVLRSATSVGANIVEAQSASSKKDFANFINHALKSAHETTYWLALLQESYPQGKSEIKILIEESKQLTKILASIILSLKGKKQLCILN